MESRGDDLECVRTGAVRQIARSIECKGGKMERANKVYCVHTGLVNKEGDNHNWRSYTLTAPDAEAAIIAAKKKKFRKGEYIESVELICELDD